MTAKRVSLMFFLFGLGAQLQLVGSLSITELIVFLLAPIVFLQDRDVLAKDGFGMPLGVCLLLYLGCLVSCVVNHSSFSAILRGFASISVVPACLIVFHRYLRKNLNAFKWYFVGNCISGVVCTFVFQKVTEVISYGGEGASVSEGIMSGPLFLISRLVPFLTVPISGWYLDVPMAYSIAAPLGLAVFSVAASVSGRSTALGMFAYLALIIIGGRTRTSLRRLQKHLGKIVVLAVIGVLAINALYRVSTMNGWLGEAARVKYERQSGGSSSIVKLLIGGRIDSFVGYAAVMDRPIVGFGPWAMDYYGYYESFLAKYGNSEDYEAYCQHRRWMVDQGIMGRDHLIGCHSCVTMFWLWYGIAGLLFWLCVIYWLFRYLKQDAFVIPQWFPWLGASIPGMLWAIFFSPFGLRTGMGFMLTGIFLARAVRRGRISIPFEMEREIVKMEHRV